MNKKHLDILRILAIAVILIAIAYFYINVFYPSLIPKSLRIGIIRTPLNILIVGTDITFDALTLEPMPEKEGRADTILLAHIDPIKSRIMILSIPRDTFLLVPGRRMQKVNTANIYGGITLLKQSITNLPDVFCLKS